MGPPKRLGLLRSGRQEDHAPGTAKRGESQADPVGRRLRRTPHGHRPAWGLQSAVAGKERRAVAVRAQPEDDQVQWFEPGHDARVEPGPLLWPELGRHPVNGRRGDPVQQRFARHPVVALGILRSDAALVAEEHRDASPLDVHAGQQLIRPPGRRAARQHQRSGATAERLRDLPGRRLRHGLGVGQHSHRRASSNSPARSRAPV